MKHLTLCLLVLILICPLWAQAQLSKGTWYVSGYTGSPLPVAQNLGDLSYFNKLGTERNLVSLHISPEIGYFFSDRFLAGARLGGGLLSKNDFVNGNSFIASPFVRYYINPKAEKTHFYANAQLNMLVTKDDNVFSGNAGVGLTHFIAPGIGLDAYLAIVEPHFEIGNNTQLGLFTSLNVYLNPDLKANRKIAVPELQAGSILIGGTSVNGQVGIKSPRGVAFNTNQMNISPNVLYFITNRLALGGAFNFGLSGNSRFSATNFGLSPRARYYLNSAQHRMLFLGAAYHYDTQKAKFREQTIKTNLSRASFAVGLNSFLTSNLALELAPNLIYNFTSDDVRVGLDLGIQFFLHPRSKE